MALRLTQPLTEMSTRNISWEVKAAGVYGWKPYQLHVPIVLKSGSFKLLETSGSVKACNVTALPFTWYSMSARWLKLILTDAKKSIFAHIQGISVEEKYGGTIFKKNQIYIRAVNFGTKIQTWKVQNSEKGVVFEYLWQWSSITISNELSTIQKYTFRTCMYSYVRTCKI